jgi:glycine/D-amino acid oxidase-like deaminating enzyme
MRSTEVLVVGAGVLGCAVALRLADGGVRVALVAPLADRRGHASRAAGAMLGVFSEVSSHDEPWRRDVEVGERLQARRLYDDWVADLAERSGIGVAVAPGLFVVANAEGENDERELQAVADAASSHGCRAELHSWRDVPGLAPERRSPPLSALELPDEGSIDASLLLDALEGALVRHSLVEVVQARVTSLAPGPTGEITARLDSGAERRASQVVLAAGVETTQLMLASEQLEAGLPPILSGRGVSILLRVPVALPTAIRTPNRSFACGLHLVPRSGGCVYVGATNRLSTAPSVDRGPTLDELATLVDGAVRQFNTSLRHAELMATAVGHRPVTVDRLPLVGRTRDPRVLVASATYRNGILLAPRVAEILAGEVLQPGSATGHPFSPQRELKVPGGLEALTGWTGRGLLAQLTASDGRLAPGRDEELERFLQLALSSLLVDGPVDDGLRRKLARLWERAPLEEVLPLIFETVARHGGKPEKA